MIRPAAKSWIIIICTLVIGMAIGFEISEITIRHRFEELRDVRVTEGFVRILGKTLKLNEQQKPGIDSILVKYHKRIDAVSKSNMTVMAGIVDSMKNEMKAKLTPEQIMRLDRVAMRLMSRPGPPPIIDTQRNRRRPMAPGGRTSPGEKGKQSDEKLRSRLGQ
ncbi:MAG: hypothetical protein ACM3P0_11905 [Acidobacteriota bacterium]